MKKYIGLFLSISLFGIIGCSNPATPAGYVGYVKRGALVGSESFYGTQEGPTSPGLSWMLKVTNISVTPYTTSETYTKVLTKDNLEISLKTHITWKIKKDKVKEFVEQYTTLQESHHDDKHEDSVIGLAYKNYLKEQFRTFSRNEITKYEALDLQLNLIKMGEDVKNDMVKHCKDSPFEVMNVVVGDLSYPEVVAQSVANKLAAKQKQEMAEMVAKQLITEAKGQANAEIERAKGVAKANEILGDSLKNKAEYLQYLWIRSVGDRDNATIIYIPTENGLPIMEAGRFGKETLKKDK